MSCTTRDGGIAATEAHLILESAMARLTFDERRVIELALVSATVDEIAAELNCSPATVCALHKAAREKLASIIGK